ncbi:leucine-rich repeat domain-containing protein [Listeria costaricensis]|uniref:leucine-rich repeat domain-containing protein n=1 Tax=Listeria costaricensis TaxID=2026604 RepID=UPI000C07496D
MKKIWLLGFIIFGFLSLQNLISTPVQADEVGDLYPLPAPIIEVFPDEALAENMVTILHKTSVNDVITQEDLDAVDTLVFSNTGITNESMGLLSRAEFNNVTMVYLHDWGSGFNTFPDVPTIPHLQQLIFDENMNRLPRQSGLLDYQNYPELQIINTNMNELATEVPDFSNTPALSQLLLEAGNLTSIPDFSHIPQLIYLDLGGNHLSEVPDFKNLPMLDELYLGGNNLTKIPDFSNTSLLELLDISDNEIDTLPDFSQLPDLRNLYVQGNILTELPDFSNTPALQILKAGYNNIAYVPNFDLPALIELDLTDNNLTGTMTDLTKLPSIYEVILDYNALLEFPQSVLPEISCDNQHGTIPSQVIAQGDQAIVDLPVYFQLESIGKLFGNLALQPLSGGPAITVEADDVNQKLILDTKTLAPGNYKYDIVFNYEPAPIGGEYSYDFSFTVE